MAHEIELFDRVCLNHENGQAWHNLGKLIESGLSATAAAIKYGYCWPVERWALQAIAPDGTRIDVDSHVANIRTADNDGASIRHLLGIVGVDYKICQNRELAEFTDALAQTGQVTIETIGSIQNGKRVWMLARGDAFTIGNNVNEPDKVWPYVMVSNGHDGGSSIRVTPTTVRTVCSNTFHMVVPRVDDGSQFDESAISIRHSGKISDKLEQAKRALAYYGETLRQNRELFERMSERRTDATQRMKLFAGLYSQNWETPTNEDLNSPDKDTRRTAELSRDRMNRAASDFMHRYEIEKRKPRPPDSLWLAFNALTGFVQHDKKARGANDTDRVEKRIESNLFGVNADRSRQALALALALSA